MLVHFPIIKLSSFILDLHVNLKRLNEWSSFLCCSLRDGDGLLIFPLHIKSLLPASLHPHKENAYDSILSSGLNCNNLLFGFYNPF